MQGILVKRYFERGLSKSLKKVNFVFFPTQSLLIDQIIKNKKKKKKKKIKDLEPFISCSSGYETTSEKLFY